MDCEEAANLISQRVDGELAVGDAVGLDAHLAVCGECRAAAEALQLQDAALVRAFAGRRAAADALATRVTAALSLPHARQIPAWRRGLLPAAVAATVFLAAGALVLSVLRNRPERTLVTQSRPTVAKVTLTSGSVFTCPSHAPNAWQPVAQGEPLGPGARVRTSPDARLELCLVDGSNIRLNGSTEARLGPGPSVELQRGQLWSAVPPQAQPLRVTVPSAVGGPITGVTEPGARADLACTSGVPVLTAVEGSAKLLSPGVETLVPAGQAATWVEPPGGARLSPADVLLATWWVDDLLVLKGRDDPERLARVNELLSRIKSEAATMRPATGPATLPTVSPGAFEQLMRGEAGRWSEPMACYVCSPASRGDREKRLTAARLLADLAPPSVIPELIALLADPESEVRRYSATALQRLTGQTLGGSPAQCAGETGASIGQTQKKWQAWWEQNRTRYGAR
jgi:ferric-dicitrate binding protein FerR (iron transport regulator)